jgi:hypothetical protein
MATKREAHAVQKDARSPRPKRARKEPKLSPGDLSQLDAEIREAEERKDEQDSARLEYYEYLFEQRMTKRLLTAYQETIYKTPLEQDFFAELDDAKRRPLPARGPHADRRRQAVDRLRSRILKTIVEECRSKGLVGELIFVIAKVILWRLSNSDAGKRTRFTPPGDARSLKTAYYQNTEMAATDAMRSEIRGYVVVAAKIPAIAAAIKALRPKALAADHTEPLPEDEDWM